MNFRIAKICKQGGRDYNEDTCDYVQTEKGVILCLSDGLGGHGGGHIASSICVNEGLASLKESSFQPEALQQAILNAQSEILEKQKQDPDLSKMRTTAVFCKLVNGQALWAHVGDSRFYHFSGGQLVFQSKDHSVPQVLASTGEIEVADIRYHEDRNRLTSALGNEDRLKIATEQSPHKVNIGDAFLLCTDGFWENITEVEMQVDMAKSHNVEQWLNLMEIRLLERVNGNHDNYSAIALWVK